MIFITLSLLIFMISVMLHLLWCRFKNDRKLHVLSFCILSAAGLLEILICLKNSAPSENPACSVWTVPFVWTSVAIYILLIPFYLVFYYSTILESPSREILIQLKKNGKMGFHDLEKIITDERFVIPRLEALVKHGGADLRSGKYYLQPKAYWLFRVLDLIQHFSGRKISG